MSDVVYLTKERVSQIEHELRQLKTKGRKEIAQKIADARSHGDLSENADYDAAKDEQGMLEMKISKLESMLAKSQVIQADEFPNDKIYILSKVKIKNIANGNISDYMMVSPEEADFEQNKLSVTSPLGKSLMGKIVGDVAVLKVPIGTTQFEIIEISK